MNTGRLYVNWVAFMALVFLLFSTVGTVGAAPANWIRSDEGLTLASDPDSAPDLFSFNQRVYINSETDLYVQLYNNPCLGWQKVTVPAGSSFFKPVGDHLYAGGSDLSWVELYDSPTLPMWNKVSFTGVPTGAIILPEAIFKGQLYAEVIGPTSDLFDIYRTPDIGKTSMAWTKVVSAGFMNPLNHRLGRLIEYNNKLIAVTTNTRTDPNAWFGDWRYYGTGIEVWESPTGDLGSWTQVSQDGFGTEYIIPADPPNYPTPTTIRTNQDFGSAAVYNGYLYVGTKAHPRGGEVWRYDGSGWGGWKNVTPDGMCAAGIGLGCGGPSRANAMIVYNNLLYLGEGVSTGNLETFDGTTWTIVVGSETSDPFMGHPFDPANRGIASLGVLPSRPTPQGGTGDKLFALTTTSGGTQIWSYPFWDAPLTCTVLKQATISVSPKTATNELGIPGQTHTITAKVDAGSGVDFSQVWVPCSIEIQQANGFGKVAGFIGANGLFGYTYKAIQGPTGLYTDTIRTCFSNSEEMVCDEATKTWVDTTPPKITITSPEDGAKYLLNAVVTANYSVQDAVGVALITITPNVSVGGPIPTGQPGTKTFTVTAKDYGNNTATKLVTYQVLTPSQGTQDLSSDLVNSQLPQDIKNGLNDKLTAAINALNLGNKKAAINILGAFINMINAQRGKTLTNAQADSWVAEAQKIIDSIKAS